MEFGCAIFVFRMIIQIRSKIKRYMLEQIQSFDKIANGNKDVFLELFEGLKNVISTNQQMMYM